MDYNTLTAQIKAYAKRDDQFFTSQIPNFINQAINRIYSEAKGIGFEITANGNLNINNPIFDKPANWKETVSFKIIDDRGASPITSYLYLRPYEFCQSYWPDRTITGTPQFFADYNNYLSYYLAPTPDYQYTVELIYLGLPDFTAANPRNFLTDRYPNLLLYACMLEAMPFLKDDERAPLFESFYNRALENINNDARKLYNDRVSKRDVT
jgi:hypothetical protein